MQRDGPTFRSISFVEHGLDIRSIETRRERLQAFRLRYTVFQEELNWTGFDPRGLEADGYDATAEALGIFDGDRRIVAYLRITPPDQTFMLEEEFPYLLAQPLAKTPASVEISRVCTAPRVRRTLLATPAGRIRVAMLLYKGFYLWCRCNRIDEAFMVVDGKLARLLGLAGFPCRRLGPSVLMPDGIRTQALHLRWREFERRNRAMRPELLAWFGSFSPACEEASAICAGKESGREQALL